LSEPDDTLPAPPSPSSLAAGRLAAVGREQYQILGELARGGLGKISRARDLRTGRPVAIKEVLRAGDDVVARFTREALVTANLQHPSIVPVYEVGRWPDGEPFYAMKLVKGRSLEDVVAETAPGAARLALLPHVIDVADALAYAHGERIVHRDLKPANVLVGAHGETVVIDWGLAARRAGEEPASLPPVGGAGPGETIAGSVMGTPAYMPPEQARGEPVDERADVYALGAILYQVLGGARPYAEARTADEILARALAGPPRPLAGLAPGAPAELLAVVDKAMARDPAHRYPTAEGMAEDLRRFQAGQLVGAHRYSAGELVRRWLRRHRAAVTTAAAALVALAVFGVYSFRRIARERDEAARARALAERRLGDGLEELGRQALLAGDPGRALPLLAGAGEGGPVRALLGGRAAAAYDGLLAVLPVEQGLLSADLDRAGERLVAADVSGALGVWSVARAQPVWTRPGPYRAALSPDDRWIAAADHAGGLTLLAMADGAPGPGAVVDEPVATLAWSPDGRRVAAGGQGGGLALLSVDGATARARAAARVRRLAFSDDGTRLAVASDAAEIAILDGTTLAEVARLPGHPGGTTAVRWLGERLVSGGADGDAVVWVEGREVVRVHHAPALYDVAVSGGLLVTAATDPVARVWDVATGAPRAALPGHHLGVNAVAVAGGSVATGDEGGTVRLWDAERGELLRTLPPDGPLWTLAARGDRVVVGGTSPRLRVFEAGAGDLARLRGHRGRLRRVAFDGESVLTASNDGTARVFAPDGGATALGGEPVADPDVESPPPHARSMRWIEAAGERLLAAREGGSIEVWDRGGALRAVWRGHAGSVRQLLVDGDRVWSAGADGARRWDLATGAPTGAIATAPLFQIARAGDRLATRGLDDSVRLWDAETLRPVETPAPLSTRLTELVVAPDGTLVLGAPAALLAVDPTTGAVVRTVHLAMPLSVDIRGGVAAVGAAGGELAMVDWVAGAVVASWSADAQVVAATRLRPDGAVVATGGGEQVVRVWEAATGRLLASSPRYPGLILSLAWSADRLLVGGVAREAWVWDLAPRADLAALAPCASPWSLDGTRLVAAPRTSACRPR
jgi:WD40 repeat protein